MKKIVECINGKTDNHILPFFWQHGETEEILRDYMSKIEENGIKAVCVEARPHPHFVEDKWWTDMDIILEEARNREMGVWIMDDSHFPTGYANGAIKEKYPEYRKRFLKLHQLDFSGELKGAQAIISHALPDEEDRLEGVYLAKKIGYEEIDPATLTDLAFGVNADGTVTFDLPEGEWKLLIVVSTFLGGETETEGYLNPIVPEATDVLLEIVYESHYSRYKEEFGRTILGFFSDEPRFGNMHGPQGSIGRYDMVLPWRDGMKDLLAERIGKKIEKWLPLLFVDGGESAHQMRYYYMDLVSDLYAEHFSERIGTWCERHGISYIGHVIEDNNASGRLGYGAGHFFRSMKGQHMAGIDVVLHQLLPGMDHGYNKAMTRNGWDGEFFHYVLAKLGASLGHMDPLKQGKVMCEVFGAYGWAEGNRMMKWITDHMLVRGVNEFCPHAFNPGTYPDSDCPPHFYAHGKNPQYPEFRLLMEYMNRMSHLLSGGIHRAPVAVCYHGEAEWSGRYMLTQKPCALLARNQIDYDILPQQAIRQAEVNAECFCINQEEFRALIVPYAEALPIKFLESMEHFLSNGIRIYILEEAPSRSSEGIACEILLQRIINNKNCIILKLEELIPALRKESFAEVQCSSYEPYLRYYHYEHKDGHIIMFTNEAPSKPVETIVTVPYGENGYQYNAMENKVEKMADGFKLKLNLSPYESALYFWTSGLNINVQEAKELSVTNTIELPGPFVLQFRNIEESQADVEEMILERLVPLQTIQGKENFTGVVRYISTFNLEETAAYTKIRLEKVYEGARVSINKGEFQTKICPPYVFDVSDSVKTGENSLIIEVNTTLARTQKDFLSQFMLLEPIGITDKVVITQYNLHGTGGGSGIFASA